VSYNILVINQSDPTQSSKIVTILATECFCATTGLSYLTIWSHQEEFKPDLIILGDTMLIDSFEACYLLRQALDIPIVMLGKTRGADAWCQAVEAGADCYLETPVYYPELIARVKAILHRYELSKLYKRDSTR